MSEQQPNDHQPSSFIKTPKQLIAVVILSFIIPIGVIAMLASFATGGGEGTPEPDQAVLARLKPVGEVAIQAGGAGASAIRAGKEVFEAVCAACHTTGALGAPKIGDTAAWAPLIKEGFDHLVQNAIKGVGKMPPKGGNPDIPDVEVARAVAYLANQSGGKFEEPAAPAADQAAAPGAAPAGAAGVPAAAGAPAATASAGAGAAASAAGTATAPATQVAAAPAAGAAAGGGAAEGKSVYQANCFACHGTGAAGAPKLGDKTAWAPRLKQGMPGLYEGAIKGKGAMPPKGGNMSLSDAQVKAAVDFMVADVK